MNVKAPAFAVALFVAALALAALMVLGRPQPDASANAGLRVDQLLGEAPAGDFARALVPGAIRFPADHGPHPAYRSEWWYFTGNLRDHSGRHFGFELTFFRFALAGDVSERTSAWAADQVYMAHFAVTDTAGMRHIAFEQLDRAALGLAGARAQPFLVWLGNWSAASVGAELFPLRLTAETKSIAVDLRLNGLKPVVFNGDEGLSRKGPTPGNASYYYSFTRLAASGRLRIGGETFDVSGAAWLDREWGTSALGKDLAGWDWFALQLDDGTDIMFYRLRRKNGSSDPFSAGSLVTADGSRRALGAADVLVENLDSWTSPASGVTYPIGWRIELPHEDIVLDVQPYLEAQEVDLSVRYWEGAVRVAGRSGSAEINGEGYVELAGYE